MDRHDPYLARRFAHLRLARRPARSLLAIRGDDRPQTRRCGFRRTSNIGLTNRGYPGCAIDFGDIGQGGRIRRLHPRGCVEQPTSIASRLTRPAVL